MTNKNNANRSLHAAKATKQDEFYTQLSDIEKELKHYQKHFKNKTVLLKQTPDLPAPSDQVVFIRAMIALKNGRLAEADRLLRKVDGLLQNSLALTLITAVAQFQAKRPAEGAAYLARGVRASPECSQWATQVPALAPFRDLPEFKKAIR